MTFEQKKRELSKIAEKLESDKTSLEEVAALFEQGMILGKDCRSLLAAEQGKITVIIDGKETDFSGD